MRTIYYLAALFNEPDIPKTPANQATLKIILQFTFGVIGAITVLVITVAGIMYITSTGDPRKTAKAKDAILFAVIGLVISISAFAIVSFTVGRI